MCIGLVGMQKHENEKNSPRDFKMAAKKHAFCWIYSLLKKNPNQLEGYVYNVNVNFLLVQSLTWVNACLETFRNIKTWKLKFSKKSRSTLKLRVIWRSCILRSPHDTNKFLQKFISCVECMSAKLSHIHIRRRTWENAVSYYKKNSNESTAQVMTEKGSLFIFHSPGIFTLNKILQHSRTLIWIDIDLA